MYIGIYHKLNQKKPRVLSKTIESDAVCNFSNSFAAETDTSILHNISSGAMDLLNAEKLGSECRKTFVENRQIK